MDPVNPAPAGNPQLTTHLLGSHKKNKNFHPCKVKLKKTLLQRLESAQMPHMFTKHLTVVSDGKNKRHGFRVVEWCSMSHQFNPWTLGGVAVSVEMTLQSSCLKVHCEVVGNNGEVLLETDGTFETPIKLSWLKPIVESKCFEAGVGTRVKITETFYSFKIESNQNPEPWVLGKTDSRLDSHPNENILREVELLLGSRMQFYEIFHTSKRMPNTGFATTITWIRCWMESAVQAEFASQKSDLIQLDENCGRVLEQYVQMVEPLLHFWKDLEFKETAVQLVKKIESQFSELKQSMQNQRVQVSLVHELVWLDWSSILLFLQNSLIPSASVGTSVRQVDDHTVYWVRDPPILNMFYHCLSQSPDCKSNYPVQEPVQMLENSFYKVWLMESHVYFQKKSHPKTYKMKHYRTFTRSEERRVGKES